MRLHTAPLLLLVCCAGCFPKKSPVGHWTTTLWSIPVDVVFQDGTAKVTGKYKDGDFSTSGNYVFSDKDGGSEFSFDLGEVSVKHGNPFTAQMLVQETQTNLQPRSYRGYLKFESVNEMDMVVESGSQESQIVFNKVNP